MLAFIKKFCYNNVCCLENDLEQYEWVLNGGAYIWQNAKFAEKVLHLVSKSAILTEEVTELGSLISEL